MTKNSCDYSDYANAVASSIADGTNDRGILICRSGIGMSIAANRWVGVRAALCRTAPAAALSRQHNDSNLLCLASAYVDNESVEDVLDAWLHADFEGGRHERRVVKSSGSPLQWTDPELAGLIQEEGRRESNNIELIASENFTSPSVREAQGSLLTNKYAEGYPGKRWYGGCEVVDKVEQLAIDRVLKIFGGDHANVQPHSGSQANMAVYFSVLKPGDTILTMDLSHGGHLTHGHRANFSGKLYNVVHYGVSQETEAIDYDALEKLALEVKPQMITAGASAYSRTIDFERMGQIARACGAYLFVDMAHIAGLVAGGSTRIRFPMRTSSPPPRINPCAAPAAASSSARRNTPKTGCSRLPRNAGRPPHAHHCRQGGLFRRSSEARIQGLCGPSCQKRQGHGGQNGGTRLPRRLQRYGQPRIHGRPPQQRH